MTTSTNQTTLTAQKYRVLLVDDEPKVLRALNAALEIEFDIHLSSSVYDAKLQIKNQDHFDVIISDQIMPEAMGHELLNWCVNNSPDSKRMMLTGLPITEQLRQKLLDVENVNLFTKPWNIEEIKQSIQKSVCASDQSENSSMIGQVLIVEASGKYQTLYTDLPGDLSKQILLNSANDLLDFQDRQDDPQLIILNVDDQLIDPHDLIESIYSHYTNTQFLITAEPKLAREILHLEKLFNRITILVKPFSLARLLHRLAKKNLITTNLEH